MISVSTGGGTSGQYGLVVSTLSRDLLRPARKMTSTRSVGVEIALALAFSKRLGLRSLIWFEEGESSREELPLKSDHLVVCEQGEELSEVIAANYAYALGADLVLVPERTRDEAEEFLEPATCKPVRMIAANEGD
jgi:hypothetical protein